MWTHILLAVFLKKGTAAGVPPILMASFSWLSLLPPLAAERRHRILLFPNNFEPYQGDMTMANIDFSKLGAALNLNEFAGAPSSDNKEKPKAQTWANLGITVQMKNEEGEMEDVFINIFGTPIDWLDEPKPYTGKSPKMQKMHAIRTVLLRQLIEARDNLSAGESLPVSGFQLEFRRVGTGQAPSEEQLSEVEEVANVLSFGKAK